MEKRFAFVTLLIAMVVLTSVSMVCAEDTVLNLISGSDVDPTTFEYDGHVVAEGFAVSISADLPFTTITQIKVGGAVAGLGDGWIESALPYVYFERTPYVKEMRLKVEGDSHYTASEIAIYDNTGTGGSRSDFFRQFLLE